MSAWHAGTTPPVYGQSMVTNAVAAQGRFQGPTTATCTHGRVSKEIRSWKASSTADAPESYAPPPSGRQAGGSGGGWPAEAHETRNREGKAKVSSFIVDRPIRLTWVYCSRGQHQRSSVRGHRRGEGRGESKSTCLGGPQVPRHPPLG